MAGAADNQDTHANSDKDEAFGLGHLERALDGSADAKHGHSRVIALLIETKAQIARLRFLDKLAAGWSSGHRGDRAWG